MEEFVDMEVTLEGSNLQPHEILSRMREAMPDLPSEVVKFHRPAFRGLQGPLIIAIVGASGTVLGALITALCSRLRDRSQQRISLSIGETKIEVPTDVSIEKVREILELIRNEEAKKVILRF